jgi:hypothetical protein
MPDLNQNNNSNESWQKLLKKNFNTDSRTEYGFLNYASSIKSLRLRIWIKAYLRDFFTVPWVFIWAMWLALLCLVGYLINTDSIVYITYRSSFPYPIAGLIKGGGNEWRFLFALGFGTLINYTISFVANRKNPALSTIMTILSFWLLLIVFSLVFLVWKFNISRV